MSENFAGWLPAGVQRRQAVEDQAERREARQAERDRADRQEQAAERALGAYRAAAEARGESIGAVELATGQGLGRGLDDIFSDAIAAADHEDARQAARAHREAGIEPEHIMVGRSDGWPSSAYEAGRMVRQAGQLHRDLVMTQAREASRRGRFGEHAAAVRSEHTGTGREYDIGREYNTGFVIR